MANTYTAVMVYTSTGESRIFAVDGADSTTVYVELVDVITGNSLGDSLQGQTIVKAMASTENFVYSPGGIVFVDNQNNVLSAVGVENPEQFQPSWQTVNIPVALNYKCKVLSQPTVA
jgi:hypothetical protein